MSILSKMLLMSGLHTEVGVVSLDDTKEVLLELEKLFPDDEVRCTFSKDGSANVRIGGTTFMTLTLGTATPEQTKRSDQWAGGYT